LDESDIQQDQTKPNYPIASVDKALRLLLSFTDRGVIRVAEASRDLEVARSTAHRLLEMLQHHEFVQQDPASRAYVPGPALLKIGLSVVRNLDVRAVARPVIEKLVEDVQESAHLVMLSGRDMLIIDAVESPRMLRIGSRLGGTIPAHAAAGGRALLATLPDERVRELYPTESLKPITPDTLTSRKELLNELEQIRASGYAISVAEVEPDVSTVAAAIRGTGRTAPAAITISVPRSRVQREDLPRLGEAAVAAAQRVADLMALSR
jgi:DNA-binding IclR family transcriptional regulator